MRKLSKYATTISNFFGDSDLGQCTAIIYHSTPIVRVTDKAIKLESGGWRTATTKKKMNQGLAELGVNFIYVFQKNYLWYVNVNGQAQEFKDGMIIPK